MARVKLGRILKRTYRRSYGKRKNPLPEKLSFLENIPFYAVTICQLPDSDQTQTRIEILPRGVKQLATAFNNGKKYRKQIRKLKNELKSAKESITCLEAFNKSLKHNNQILMENIESNEKIAPSNMKSYFQLAEEKCFEPKGLPLQGGLPSLGKKKR